MTNEEAQLLNAIKRERNASQLNNGSKRTIPPAKVGPFVENLPGPQERAEQHFASRNKANQVTCWHCHKPFTRLPGTINDKVFCSPTCEAQHVFTEQDVARLRAEHSRLYQIYVINHR